MNFEGVPTAMAEERKPKRPKITRGDDGYMPGNITEIELCNFMTFNKLTCKPDARLNLVLGPNGSGKSSIVCAIALGLGGEPQLLGRATSIGAYVKRGEESGYIRICLRGENKEDPIAITRKIDTTNKSEWLLNGKSVPKKDVSEVIQRFNIQVGNLTQFLPQDRVCEFAKLSPIQLLEETEKAVGDPRLPVQHQTLITKSQELKKFERAVESNSQSLDHLRALNAELEKDVKRVRQREELLAKAESMKKKLPWLKYDMKKAEYMEAKKLEEISKLKLDEAAKALNTLREPIEKLKGEKTKVEAKCRKFNGLLDSSMRNRMQLFEKYDNLGILIRGKYDEVEELRRQEDSRQRRLLKAKQDLALAEEAFANHRTYEPPRQEMEQLSAQIMELEETANDIRSQRREKEKQLNHHKSIQRQCMDRLKEMENANNKRLYALKNSGAEKIFEASRWVQEHQNQFNKDVYGPVLLEVTVPNQMHANYLEGQVANYIWKAFITQDPEDRDLLVRNLRSYDVPVINHVQNDSRRREPFHTTDDMKKLGISSRLDLVFEAPDAVKDVLIGQFMLDHSYIGSKVSDEKADLVSKLGIMNLWTPENHYQWSRSRYGSHVSGSVESVDRSRLLSCSVDFNEIDSAKSKLTEIEGTVSSIEANLKALQIGLRQKEDEAAEHRRAREEIVNTIQIEKKKLREMEQLVNQRKAKVKSIERENDPQAEEKLKEQAGEFKIQLFKCVVELKNLLTEAVAFRRGFTESNMCTVELEAKIKEMESRAKEQEKIAMQASLSFDQFKKAVENRLRELSAAKKYAESIAVITRELKQAFLEMPTTVGELEAAIQDTISEANSILFLNQNILEEYESRQRKIEELTSKQAMNEKDLHNRLNEINSLKEIWLPTLRSLVTRINETFSQNFQEMAVAGEVSLDEHGTDFDQYGILIKVKFRQTGQLQVLSAHHQSGGERSVSTILYLVSLQDLTNCPFRVVDEINQGMDPINERKMFQQLVRASSQPNTPQCFLLSPKLLEGLEYGESCTIFNVMNGPWIEQPSKVWSSGENWRNVGIPVTENHC